MPVNTTDNTAANQQSQADPSVSTFVSALLFNLVIAVAVYIAFSIVRHWNKKVYEPRTYLVKDEVRSPDLPPGIFSWITASFAIKDNTLVDRIGLDAYMFLRFQRLATILFTGFTLLGIPILIPINVINGQGEDGLKAMTIGNVAESWRLWFHLVLTVVFAGATVYMLWKEMLEYTRRRHAYLLSPKHAKTPQATTILVTSIPDGLHSETALFNIFNRFPGGVRSVWLNRNPKKLIELCQERDNIALKLESAEYAYIRSAYEKPKEDEDVKEPVRPFGRTSAIPFVGPKVDLIDTYSKELSKLNKEIEEERKKNTPDSVNSAFIRFHTQFAAHSAVQTVVHPSPFQMAPMYAEISPLDVVWDNMNLHIYSKKVRTVISVTLATALALTWSIPVVFVSSIASISALVHIMPFLSFLNTFPSFLVGIIQGILPPVFMAILMALLPIILTLLSKFEGHVRYSSITHAVMSKYFVFLIINVLLISTLTGGIFSTIAAVKDQGFSPINIISMIATKLPGVSTFFVTYAMLQGFSGPMMILLQIAPLVLNYVFTVLLAKSPRQIWNVQGRLPSVDFGTLFPPQTLMFAVGILYATIAPLVLPFVAVYFALYYFVFRHMFLYVFNQPVESGGLAFPLAVKQAYAGLFISEITVFGIFLIKLTDINVLPHLIILAILIIVTIVSYSSLNEAFNPLVTFLPVALFSEELHIGEDGVVTDGNNVKIHDDEAGLVTKNQITNMDSLTLKDQSSEKASLAVLGAKQEYDETNEVSSQLPGVPTPNPSMLDSSSYSRQSLQPPTGLDRIDSRRDKPVSFAPSIHSEIITHEEEDPELRRLQDQAYCHPSTYTQQVPIWLPLDQRGLVTEEIGRLTEMDIIVATTGAGIDPATGKTHVSGILFAPGEETNYRLDRGE
ncbi:hypothetical protein BGZ46_000082 [Entomortierella lignicola]|nr:hypothetical protein BGZ46_000082 [Entomortierella lignicola]